MTSWPALDLLSRVRLACKGIVLMMQGLSEPLGALMALLLIKPFLTPMRLQYMLAFVGGVMVKSMPLTRAA